MSVCKNAGTINNILELIDAYEKEQIALEFIFNSGCYLKRLRKIGNSTNRDSHGKPDRNFVGYRSGAPYFNA